MKKDKEQGGRVPDPKEIEKEIGEFLAKKFGGEVKLISPASAPQAAGIDKPQKKEEKETPKIVFDLKPRELIAYLDQYIVKQDQAKAVLATKICTHFNRIKRAESLDESEPLVGRIKNNVLMLGPTGVGKTYMIKLIAQKLGVPFVKGDATKFSETGYVGADVDDLIRDLVREADDDIELAQYGIVYVDEIDKIASSRNLIGADVSRTGVQRALLKPMEETEVELKVPHDPISVFQEIERFRKTGKRDKTSVNTRNILFIMSGAFGGLSDIIEKRLSSQAIGFGSQIKRTRDADVLLKDVQAEDLIEYGFESEFVGRLPVHAVLERLTENDLFAILKNPNNPVVLGKKIDFAAYGINVRFSDDALRKLAGLAYNENTGARGLVSAVEKVLMPFERDLPSFSLTEFPVTGAVVDAPEKMLHNLLNAADEAHIHKEYEALVADEKEFVCAYVVSNKSFFEEKHKLTLTPSRVDILADFYIRHTLDMEQVLKKIKSYSELVKKIELYFYKSHDINIVMEEDAIDYLIEQLISSEMTVDGLYKKLSLDFEMGLKLVRDKTGKSRFFITRQAVQNPEEYISGLIQHPVQ